MKRRPFERVSCAGCGKAASADIDGNAPPSWHDGEWLVCPSCAALAGGGR